jgi:hypothetical protein
MMHLYLSRLATIAEPAAFVFLMHGGVKFTAMTGDG